MVLKKQIQAADYKRIFEETAGGDLVLEDLTRRFGRAIYMKGGTEGDRQTCYNAGQRSVLDYILSCVNSANGVDDDISDESNSNE